MKVKNHLLIFLVLLLCTEYSVAQDERQKNDAASFDKMELQGVDTKSALPYNYYFYDKSKAKLEKVKLELTREGYKVIKLEPTDKSDFILQPEKVETHTKATITALESKLKKTAIKYAVAKYSGWEVIKTNSPSTPTASATGGANNFKGLPEAEVYRMASDFYEKEMNDQAITAFGICIDKKFRLDTSYYKQGVSYINNGQVKIGIVKLEQAYAINPKYFKVCFNLGATYYGIKDYQKSIEYYQKASKINPQSDRAFYGIAASQYDKGMLKEAEANCQTALKINPENEEAKILMGNIKRKNS